MKTAARFIKHESIKIGDTIKVEENIADITVTRVGTVAKRDHSHFGTDYVTAQGVALYTHTRDGLKTAKITLLARALNVSDMTDRLF